MSAADNYLATRTPAELRHLSIALARSFGCDGRQPLDTGGPFGAIVWAVYCDLVDLEAERAELVHQARRDRRTVTADPDEIAALEAAWEAEG